ncbi:Rieske (2Fe-2S) iron-sulfur domain protein [[Leptolyngbya] sp. PCC 7376]|uniref:Rieske 2Fe-2S domain-containing protein n=1 Tax=[Leptolyngbya] sp. PCC 7376 TaxID=111781 RepID=UPI00029F1CC5|nr:Rieske 2Fe-2S domain-containing protein [[Leptolyngbya] sp. PCC 7376]AFY39167.1 Rieske (2Fe-2S) iron-sulfur domain protein [[Leptolyngbya] sp. PCC 7376]
MKRREFLSWVGLGAIATSLPVAIAACSDGGETESTAPAAQTEKSPEGEKVEIDTTPREDGFAAIGTVEQLDEEGSISNKNFNGEQVAVIRDPAASDALIAVNAFCTHQGCTVAWAGESFDCPCHGSKFSESGEVLSGPASKELGTFTAMIEEELVYVKVA